MDFTGDKSTITFCPQYIQNKAKPESRADRNLRWQQSSQLQWLEHERTQNKGTELWNGSSCILSQRQTTLAGNHLLPWSQNDVSEYKLSQAYKISISAKQWLRSACAFAQSDQHLRSLFCLPNTLRGWRKKVQSNLNGSNIFGTIEVRSRHG